MTRVSGSQKSIPSCYPGMQHFMRLYSEFFSLWSYNDSYFLFQLWIGPEKAQNKCFHGFLLLFYYFGYDSYRYSFSLSLCCKCFFFLVFLPLLSLPSRHQPLPLLCILHLLLSLVHYRPELLESRPVMEHHSRHLFLGLLPPLLSFLSFLSLFSSSPPSSSRLYSHKPMEYSTDL